MTGVRSETDSLGVVAVPADKLWGPQTSSNDSFPSATYIAAAVNVTRRLLLALTGLRDTIAPKAEEWKDIVKIGRAHMWDATPIWTHA